MRLPRLFAIAVICLLAALPAAAYEWRSTGPCQRGLATMVIDTLNHRALLYGGCNYYKDFSDAWECPLDTVSGYRWLPVNIGGTPPARYGHAAIYDPTHQRMFVFGGADEGVPRSDLWYLDQATHAWQQVGGPGPSARVFLSAVYVPSRRSMLILDGNDGNTGIDDLWELNLDSLTWRQVSVTGNHPSARWSYGMVYDPPANRLVVFGGQSGNQMVEDVWALDLTPGSEYWSELSPAGSGPGVLASFGCCLDQRGRKMLVFGGFTYPPFTPHNALYLLNLASLEWTRASPSGVLPDERRVCAAEYDPVNGCLIVFGGESWSGHLNDTPWLDLATVGVTEWREQAPASSEPLLVLPTVGRAPVRMRYVLAQPGPLKVRVMNEAGRVVRTLWTGRTTQSSDWLTWSGKDDAGRTVPAGTYFMYLDNGRRGTSRAFTLLR